MTTTGEVLAHAHLRVLVANQNQDRLDAMAEMVEALGHVVAARTLDVSLVGAMSAAHATDIAIVSRGPDDDHALAMIEQIVHAAACPVVALLHAPDPAFVREAARRGIFAVVTDREPQEWESALRVVLARFAEHRDLRAAFGRRATIERASGVLMERHSVRSDIAFGMLRNEARSGNRKVVDIATAVLDGHPLLP